MRYVFAVLCFLALPVYAASQPTLKQVIASSDPLSGNFPASCQSPMAKLQMAVALQRWVGNRMGDEVESITPLPYGESHSADGYNCYLQVEWRDQGDQQGMLILQKFAGRIIFHWQPNQA